MFTATSNCLTVDLNQRKIYIFKSDYLDENCYVMLFKSIRNNVAVVVDPNRNSSIVDFLKDNDVDFVYILLTHEHSDHTSGVYTLQQNFKDKSKLFCTKFTSEKIAVKANNRPIMEAFVIANTQDQDALSKAKAFSKRTQYYALQSDITFDDKFELNLLVDNENIYECTDCHESFNENSSVNTFAFKKTIGHSLGSCCIKFNDECVFTGDSLILEKSVITRFYGGNMLEYEQNTKPYLDNLPNYIIIMPGHGNVFKMSDYRESFKNV